ncbi:MAG: efflux RND transporter periplasmic adaptor subunit [Pseudomonadota bacterium]
MRTFLKILREAVWLVVAVAIIAGGFLGFQFLGANRDIVEPEPVVASVPVVETTQMARAENGIPISANGFIRAGRSLEIAAQAGGRITELHPAINNRGIFDKGDVLFRLDDRQARASLGQLNANMGSAVAQKALVQTQLDRVRTLRERGIVPQDQLDQLLTQMQEMDSTIRGLEANIESAQVALDFTVVKAPFDGRVQDKLAEAGAVINQGAAVARIYSSDDIEMEIALREDEASLIPDLFDKPTATAAISAKFSGQDYQWEAEIARVDRLVDSQTRTIDVTLRLLDPENGQPVSGNGPSIPALLNGFANATVIAQSDTEIFVAPHAAVRANEEIWLARDNVLQIVNVDVLHRDGTDVFFTVDELSESSEMIISQLAAATDGMEIDIRRETAAAAVGGAE